MGLIGYHASHEQHRPSDLVRHVEQAEAVGFDAISSSDHFTPWNRAQGESGFAWSWLGAAMTTTSVPFGVVNAPAGNGGDAARLLTHAETALYEAKVGGRDRVCTA